MSQLISKLTKFLSTASVEGDAAHLIRKLTLSSRGSDQLLTPTTIKWLQAHGRNESDYTLYRGISPSLNSRQLITEWHGIVVGGEVPEKYLQPTSASTVVHTSHSEKVAKSFSRGGEYRMVYKMVLPFSQILFDSNFFTKTFSPEAYSEDPEDYTDAVKYFKSAKEVFCLKPLNPKHTEVVFKL